MLPTSLPMPSLREKRVETAVISEKHVNWLTVNKLKICSRIAAQKPLLTEKMKPKRWLLPRSMLTVQRRTELCQVQ
jgi:hypothetical protein